MDLAIRNLPMKIEDLSSNREHIMTQKSMSHQREKFKFIGAIGKFDGRVLDLIRGLDI